MTCKTLLCTGQLYKKRAHVIILSFTAQVTDLLLPGTRLPFRMLHLNCHLSACIFLFILSSLFICKTPHCIRK